MERFQVIEKVRKISNQLEASDRYGYKRYRSIVSITYKNLSGLTSLLNRSREFRYRRSLLLSLLYTNRLKSVDLSHEVVYNIVSDRKRERIVSNTVLAIKDGLFQCIRGEIAARLVGISSNSATLCLESHDQATISQIPELKGYKVYSSTNVSAASKILGRKEVFLCIVIGLFNFFSLIIGAGAYINRYKRLNIVELQRIAHQFACLIFL